MGDAMTVHVLAVVPGVCHVGCSQAIGPCGCKKYPPTVWQGHPLTCQTCKGDGYTGMGPWCLRPRCTACVGGAPIIDWQLCPYGCTRPSACALMEHHVHAVIVTVRVSIRAVPIRRVLDRFDGPEVTLAYGRDAYYGKHPVTLPDHAKEGDFAIIGTEAER